MKDAPRRPGISMLPSLTDGTPIEHESLWWYHQGNRAIRVGDWKLSSRYVSRNETSFWELYNLKEDRSETNDLAAKHPEVVAKLDNRWEQIAEGFRTGLIFADFLISPTRKTKRKSSHLPTAYR